MLALLARTISCPSMNPYSFKRFLQNPERPRHPVQLVRSDANNILVHGELPDCVQGPNSTLQPSVIPDLNPVLSQLAESVSANSSQPAVPTSGFSNTLPSPSSSSEFNTTYSDGLTVSSGRPTPPPLSLPDIHPSNTTGETPHRTPSPVYSTRTLDILHGGLPDFLLNRFPETVTSNYHQSLRTPCIIEHRGKRVVRVASLPPTSKRNVLHSSRILSRSHDRLLLSGGQVDCFSNSFHQALLNSVSAVDALEPRGSMLFSNLKVDLCQPPAAQCIACDGAKSQVVAEQQQQIHKLLLRQAELEDQLDRTKSLLADRELLLVTLRAEFEVVERQAELRIKALEHELAKEKLQSAQDRWLAVQLKNQQDRRNGNESEPSTSLWNHSIPVPLCPFSNYGDPFESMRAHTWTAADLSAVWPLFEPVTEHSNTTEPDSNTAGSRGEPHALVDSPDNPSYPGGDLPPSCISAPFERSYS
ncbi:hypothetical protein P879_05695 [Paragonimus westermani]|uniref:Uncharacterized protein n=1 Tax=Paragonimus westermani TaxID=34504 RepID=A0A8T0DTN4_9TREM|nr:hypothetical protein P879_05695 [Paragonimus westermani]